MNQNSSRDEILYAIGVRIAELASQQSANGLSADQVKAIARDLLPQYPVLLDALLLTMSRPEYKTLVAESQAALRQAKKDSLINSLVEIFTPTVISQLSSLLDGLLGVKKLRKKHNYSEARCNEMQLSRPPSVISRQSASPDSSGIKVSSQTGEISSTVAKQKLTEINVPFHASANARHIRIIALSGFGLLVAMMLSVYDYQASFEATTSTSSERSDCNAKRNGLEQQAMYLPSYRTVKNDIYFTQTDGLVLSPWKAGGETWQAVYSALTNYDYSRPQLPTAEQIAFINNAREYKNMCEQ